MQTACIFLFSILLVACSAAASLPAREGCHRKGNFALAFLVLSRDYAPTVVVCDPTGLALVEDRARGRLVDLAPNLGEMRSQGCERSLVLSCFGA